MTRITVEEAKALWINVKQVTQHEMLVKWAMTEMQRRFWNKFDTQKVVKPKKQRKTKEDNDAEKLCAWLNLNKYKFLHTPNESWVWWKAGMLAWLKKKRMGLSPWYPDFTIYAKCWDTIHIELKKPRTKKQNWEFKALSSDGIVCSQEQKEWIEFLNTREWHIADFCFWFDDSIRYLKANDTI